METASATLETRRDEAVCATCGHAYWRWQENRDRCRQCEPRPEEDRLILEAIARGEVGL